MRDHPSSPRQGSPGPQGPRRLSDELGDFMSSTDDDYEDDDYSANGGLETPMSSRKSSQSDGFFEEDDEEEEEEEFPPFKPPPITTTTTIITERKVARIDYATDYDTDSRPMTATSPPPFRRSSTCPVITPDFLSSAADEVVRIMPEQADFMKRMVEGWREIQRRSSVSVMAAAPSPLSLSASPSGPGGTTTTTTKRPHTAPSPMFPPAMNFSSFPRTVPEALEEEQPASSTESEASFIVAPVPRPERVESTIDELRVFAKQSAEAAIAASPGSWEEQDAKFAVVERCIDTIGRVYDRKPERGRRRRKLGMKCVGALVKICEMFASEGPDGGSYRFESNFSLDETEREEEDNGSGSGSEIETDGGESEPEDYADDEAEYELEEKSAGLVARAWRRKGRRDLKPIESGFFLGGDLSNVETDKKSMPLPPPPPSPTKDPFDERRHTDLVEQARAELDTLFAAAAEADTPFEERHSRVVYAVEAYLGRLSEMEASHDREFKWHAELKAFHVAMGSRNMLGSEPGTAMALVASLFFCFTPIATVLWYVTEPTTTWMLWRILIPIGCYFLLLAGFYIDQKEARDALYEEHLPVEAREMRGRHKREKELLQAAHERAVQKVYSPDS
ncbi:uncharacterized protein CTRU02_210537 [Colletotrichum truncatum]|uniref:Uncharacterized protein n=1 Tax=Colletotrichum truncatum TaxID=5467 RepID=A0ACC3YP92_COLTU|nr:uncharacterized protein CTRU02_12738 [Colletotrichum truncatum]KAF6784209.1 hypothetical protein CTRU02_12738 [Colletotrichum truncatum]